ncbi:type III effector protein [Streptomyces reniochalinae]|uniref:Type III effector protein n=1 Tax=Streptomyces reniochalinae TaxID=2250578 RepID=A0A367E9D0_9ACTN|nr:type III effector protein [Streptomyces reniochalinae]RCG14621.1 type III effector protein [Streptomyces reniochalinae]
MPAKEGDPASPPASFPAAKAALETIEEAVRTAQAPQPDRHTDTGTSAEQALAALLLLRRLRDRLGGWETGLIETAREAGASWADLAHPLGVANRQSAERRYLRLRPGAPDTTGEQRIQATRDRRAAERSVTAWARDNAAILRQLAGEITALTDLPATARVPLTQALGEGDAARLIAPLTGTGPHLATGHPALAARVEGLAQHTEALRQAGNDQRRSAP